eukprot:GHVT01009868.1.p1 GENE.GHVT01009868.1~~GHVT01009868.1.p1  ORF type:complete len:169 (+),score=41.14 GHVT01009868.1:899-1405(+)
MKAPTATLSKKKKKKKADRKLPTGFQPNQQPLGENEIVARTETGRIASEYYSIAMGVLWSSTILMLTSAAATWLILRRRFNRQKAKAIDEIYQKEGPVIYNGDLSGAEGVAKVVEAGVLPPLPSHIFKLLKKNRKSDQNTHVENKPQKKKKKIQTPTPKRVKTKAIVR